MIITLEKHGGFLPFKRRQKVVDTATLPKEEVEEVTNIVAQVQAATSKAGKSMSSNYDAMTYEIKIRNNDNVVRITQKDSDISPAFSELLKWIYRQVSERP